VIEAIGVERMPATVFVTAFDEYAVRAFEVQALDYLLKPFGRQRFQSALARARRHLERERQGAMAGRLAELLQMRRPGEGRERILVKSGGRVSFIEIDAIDWVEAEGNYVRLHAGKESYLLRDTISALEAQLDPRKFVRVHRSAIVNIDRIQELQPWFHGEYRIVLGEGVQLTLSRGYRERLHEAIGRPL
jgi:two-component system LytT family response regulator